MRPLWLLLALIFAGRVRVTARVLYTEQFGRWGGAVPTEEDRARWERQNWWPRSRAMPMAASA